MCPPREKALILHQESEISPNNSIMLFLFNGVPSGAFLVPCILGMFEGVRSGWLGVGGVDFIVYPFYIFTANCKSN